MLDLPYVAVAKQAQKIVSTKSIPDITSYILQNPEKWPASWLSILADQWYFQKKAKQKLGPWLTQFPDLVGPPKLSWEQSSSYQTALWKTSLITPQTSIVDMTGGWGIDSLCFAQAGAHVTHCEIQSNLSEILEENARQMNLFIQTYRGSSFDYLSLLAKPVDLLYIDPARRDAQQKKVVQLKDLTPDLSSCWDALWNKTSRILIKLSPMMDLADLSTQIPGLFHIRLLSVRNELKEILVEARKDFSGEVTYESVEIPAEGEPISYPFHPMREQHPVTLYAEPRLYVYEPFVGILKGGAFHQIAADWQLEKLHPNSHLYTSERYDETFPGRIFKVLDAFKAKPEEAFQRLGKPVPANILVRNFGENGEVLAKKWQIKPLDTFQFLIFTQTIIHKKRVLYAHRMK